MDQKPVATWSHPVVLAVIVSSIFIALVGGTFGVAVLSQGSKLCGSGFNLPGCITALPGVADSSDHDGSGAATPFNSAGTGGATSAISWAAAFEQGGSNYGSSAQYDGWCLRFVANAYGAAAAGYNSAWLAAVALVSSQNRQTPIGSIPRGALVFFKQTSSNDAGHVGISLGGGKMISALTIQPVVETSTLTGNAYWAATYYGWAWPPASWGPLARQASVPNAPAAPAVTQPTTLPQQPAAITPQSSSLQPAGSGSALQPAAGPVPQSTSIAPSPTPGASTPGATAPSAPGVTTPTSVPVAPPAPNRTAITSYNRMQPNAPYHGVAPYFSQAFTASSNTLTQVGVTWGSQSYPAGQTISGLSTQIEICTSVGSEASQSIPCNGLLAQATAPLVNYGNSSVDLGDVAVTPGSTYYIVSYPPAASPNTWVCYWWTGGPTEAASDQMQMIVTGYNR